MSSSAAKTNSSTTPLLNLLGILGLLILASIVLMARQTERTKATGDSFEAREMDKWRAEWAQRPSGQQPGTQNFVAPMQLTNEYGLVTTGPDKTQNAINQMVTECGRAAGITDKIDKKHLLILTTCIDIKTGAYKRKE